jgi:hypothetical protein
MAKKKKDDDAEPKKTDVSDGSVAVNDAWTGMLAVSLLALVVGSVILIYDYTLYSDEPPKTPKYTSAPPGAPGPGPGPVKQPQPKVEPPKDADKKDGDKKDAVEKN